LFSHNYYYFIASLPYINYGDKPPVSSAEFIEQCKNYLSPGDLSLLRYCIFDPKIAVETVERTGSAFIDQFLLWERARILALASLRAARQKRQFTAEVSHDMPRAEALAKSVFDMDDPLEAELSIDRARWGVLDEMLGLDFFGVNRVYVYLWKLELLERRERFNAQKGADAYRQLYDNILNNYNSGV